VNISVSYEKRARIRLDKPGGFSSGDTSSFAGWATYVWNDKEQLWVCYESNEGFHRTSGIDYELSDKQMTLISLGVKNESR